MLSAADAQLVRRDPQIPGLGMLLDPEAFAEILQRLYPEAGVETVQPRYVRYKRATSCLVGYRVVAAGAQLDVYARAHNRSMEVKVDKPAQQRSVPSPLGQGIMVMKEAAIVIYAFPNDDELCGLQWLSHPGRRREMLERLLPDRSSLWTAPLEPLRYKPERRYVARLHTPDDRGAVLKFYTKDEFRINSAITFVSRPPLRIPQSLGRSRQDRLTAAEWLEGQPLRDALSKCRVSADTCRTIGSAIACLHAQKPKLRRFVTAESYVDSLANAALAVAEVAPEIAERAQRLSQQIGDRLLNRHFRSRRAIHGDFSADQVLLQDGEVAIVDFDRAGYGDPRIDLGTFRARLAGDVVRGELSDDRAESVFSDLLEEYRLESKKDVTRNLARFISGSLLQCAVEPFRHRHENWPQYTEAIIAQAEGFFSRD